MKLDIDDLNNFSFSTAIMLHGARKMNGFIEDYHKRKELVATYMVNGFEVPGEVMEDYWRDYGERLEKRLEERYADLEDEVERRLEKRLKQEAAPILEKMEDLSRVLEEVGNVIKPHWEK